MCFSFVRVLRCVIRQSLCYSNCFAWLGGIFIYSVTGSFCGILCYNKVCVKSVYVFLCKRFNSDNFWVVFAIFIPIWVWFAFANVLVYRVICVYGV